MASRTPIRARSLNARTPSRLFAAGSLFASLFAAVALPALAADPVGPPKPPAPALPSTRPANVEIAQTFGELASTEPAVREAARVRLMGLPRADLPLLEKIVKENAPIAPSQAAVLREIVTQVYLSGETYDASGHDGFLGVKLGEVNIVTKADNEGANLPQKEPNPFQPQAGVDFSTTGVVILERMPGFCGARMLQDGDVVLGVVERPNVMIRNPSEMRQAVMGFGAGQTLHFQLLRQGQVIRVPITLDPRPDEADIMLGIDAMKNMLDRRKARAEEYWLSTFAPLLKERVG